MVLKNVNKRTKPCIMCKQNKVKCEYDVVLPCLRCVKYDICCQFPNNARIDKVGDMKRLVPDSTWSNMVDNKLKTFESSLETILSILCSNQHQKQDIGLIERSKLEYLIKDFQKLPNRAIEDLYPRIKLSNENINVQDFRVSKILSKPQAQELLDIFSEHFSHQLFGYNINLLTAERLWDESPLLLVSICTVTCQHHKDLFHLYYVLKQSLKWFTSNLLCEIDRKLHMEYTILALVIAVLWLDSAQMFISIAIQLGRIWRLDQYKTSNMDSQFWKLWYLLYILDGNQNLTYYKSPSIYSRMEPIIENARTYIIDNIQDPVLKKFLRDNDVNDNIFVTHRQLKMLNEVDHLKINLTKSSLQDLRLLGQLEYNMAVECIFHDKYTTSSGFSDNISLQSSIALLDPKLVGIPWKNNMDLDRWMISWTIALQHINIQNDAWGLKSTLLYYNFARLHINSKVLLEGKKRSLNINSTNNELFQLWNLDMDKSSETSILSHYISDPSEEISRSSAISLIKLAVKDPDIKAGFQFLPIHIYIMLYFASLVLLNPSDMHMSKRSPNYLSQARESIILVTKFKEMIIVRSTSDEEFKRKLIYNLDRLLGTYISKFTSTSGRKYAQLKEILETSENVSKSQEKDGMERVKSILAWPGTNHGHP